MQTEAELMLDATEHNYTSTANSLQEEYFRAMATIEKGAAGGHYRFDH